MQAQVNDIVVPPPLGASLIKPTRPFGGSGSAAPAALLTRDALPAAIHAAVCKYVENKAQLEQVKI